MSKPEKLRRMRIIVSDEETGEEVASANGVETMILLVAPDTRQDDAHRRILIGDLEQSFQLLFDIFRDVSGQVSRGTIMDPTDFLDDTLLLEITEELPLH